MAEVKTVLSKYMELIDYAIYHAPLLRNHKEFGEKMRDIRFEIGELEEGYKRIVLAANGRGMVSEMLNMQEAVVLVCGLHDKVLLLEAKEQPNEICQYQRYQDNKGYSWYETQCGNSVDLEVSPISNGFTYCPFCAGTIEYILDADTDDDFAESELSNDEMDDEVKL